MQLFTLRTQHLGKLCDAIATIDTKQQGDKFIVTLIEIVLQIFLTFFWTDLGRRCPSKCEFFCAFVHTDVQDGIGILLSVIRDVFLFELVSIS